MLPAIGTAPIQPQQYITYTDSAHMAPYVTLCGQLYTGNDVDYPVGPPVTNTVWQRTYIFLQNTSGSPISPGVAINFVASTFGVQGQVCPTNGAIRAYAPGWVNGNQTNTIPNNAFFLAVVEGPTTMISDGSAIALGDGLVVGGTAGQMRTNYGLGGGEVFAQTVPSTVLTNTSVATKYDQNYTFPARSLHAGDTIRVTGEISIPSGNSTDTLTTDIMLGTQVVGTQTAFDPTNGGGDIINWFCEIEIRTDGASGTMVANGWFSKNVSGTTTVQTFQLASTAIDTTAVQQLAIRGTWSAISASDQSRLDELNIARLNTTGVGITGGTAMAAVSGGSATFFRGMAKKQW